MNNNELKEYSETIKSMNRTLSKSIYEAIKPTYEALNAFKENIRIQFEQINKTLTDFAKSIPKFYFDFESLKETQKMLVQRMLHNGWYFSILLPLNPVELLELSDRDFNKYLCEFYELEFEEMSKKIIINFPNRKRILEKCFNAHRNKDYELSIPVMLAQADGISYELFEKKLFSKKDGVPETKYQELIEFSDNSYLDLFYLMQLSITGQLNKNCKVPKYFNRHTVMHGIDTNYAKKINSVRCISILNFLAEIKEEYINNCDN